MSCLDKIDCEVKDLTKIPKNRSDSEMFAGWKEPETNWLSGDVKEEPVRKVAKEKEAPSNLPASTHKELERLLMEIKLDFFCRGIQDVSYILKKQGDSIILTLEPKEPKK